MTFTAIKLNPSQELKLLKARAALFGSGQPLSLDKKNGRVRQKVLPGQAIFLRPLLCVTPDDFGKEEFLSIKKFELYSPRAAAQNAGQSAGHPTCFWARLETKARRLLLPIPFALDYSFSNDFSLEKVFSLAAELRAGADKGALDGMDFLFCASSFKICRAEITKNEWRLYDEAWKKVKIQPLFADNQRVEL